MPQNNFYYNGELVPYARELRKNMTRHERHLWYDFLRHYPIKTYRQREISGYIADFYCPAAKLIIGWTAVNTLRQTALPAITAVPLCWHNWALK